MVENNLVVIVVDRFHAGMLGAYGNSWIRSKHLDRLASESFIFDQAFLESPRLDATCRAYWHGLHANEDFRSSRASLPQLAHAAGMQTALLSDSAEVIDWGETEKFSERQLLDATSVDEPCKDIAGTQTARLFAKAETWLEQAREPFLLWIHAQAMGGPWDAPQALRDSFADAEDPPPPSLVIPPDYRLSESVDPDEVLGVTHAYAGQVAVLDASIGAWLERLAAAPFAERTAVALLGARGFPLGEHGRIGPCDDALYNELTQTPCIMRFPDGLGKLARSQALVQPSDLPGTLWEWLLGERTADFPFPQSLLSNITGESQTERQFLAMTSSSDRALRTPAWLLRLPNDGVPELFAKPSDRWEVNEVAKLCRDIVGGLEDALRRFESAADQQLGPLDDALVTVID